MSLRNVIEMHESMMSKKMLIAMSMINPMVLMNTVVTKGTDLLMERMQVSLVLDGAYNPKDYLSDDDLCKRALRLTQDVELFYSHCPHNKDKVAEIKQDYLMGKLEFYRRLINQDGLVETYVDAVRQEFENEQDYREVTQPMLDADKREYDLMMTTCPITMASAVGVFDVIKAVREIEIKYLFEGEPIDVGVPLLGEGPGGVK